MTEVNAVSTPKSNMDTRAPRGPYLHSPLIDFLFLGGGSIPVLIVAILLLGKEHQTSVLVTASVLAVFINNPHFIASYQVFYERFGEKISQSGSGLQHRYWFAGIAVPAALIIYFVYYSVLANPRMLGGLVNVMFFLVGWHYVKQGYGILIVESVLHRSFFSETEKKILRWNGLAAWIFSWIYGNRLAEASNFHGVEYVTIGIPVEAAWVSGAAALAMGMIALAVLARRAAARSLPFNGACGYVAAVYLWMLLAYFDPMFLLLGPLFHSLQYLAVVWRYQLNKAAASTADEEIDMLGGFARVSTAQASLIRFVFRGLIFGAFAFFVVPILLDWAITYREEIFGPSMFLFMFIVFINIHHYFMDNVMWRKENPDISANLFR